MLVGAIKKDKSKWIVITSYGNVKHVDKTLRECGYWCWQQGLKYRYKLRAGLYLTTSEKLTEEQILDYGNIFI